MKKHFKVTIKINITQISICFLSKFNHKSVNKVRKWAYYRQDLSLHFI